MTTLPALRQNRLSRRHFVAMTGAGAIGLLSACASAVNQPAAAPKRGGTLKLATSTDAIPTQAFGSYPGNFFVGYVFDTLTRMNTADLSPKPVLATSWSYSDANTTMTLTLRKGVKYHSGRPFSGQDVIGSIQQQQNPARNSQMLQLAKVITDMSASGDQVKLRLAHPLVNVFDLFELTPIIDLETVSDLLKGSTVNGTGPFAWSQWARGSSVTLDRNRSYWQSGAPLLNKLVFEVIADEQAAISALESNQVQIIGLTPQAADQLRGDRRYAVTQGVGPQITTVSCNVDVPPLNSKPFRQAISWAVDRDDINRKVYAGVGQPTAIPWATSSPAYSKTAASSYHLDPSRARQLVQAAGVSPQFPLYYRADSTAFAQTAQIVQANLKQVGVAVQLIGMPDAQLTPLIQQGKVPGAWVQSLGLNYLHPATFLVTANPLRATRPTTNVNDPAYAELVQRAVMAPNQAAAKADYQKITNYYVDEQYVINLVNVPGGTFAQVSTLKGIQPEFFTSFGNLSSAHL